MIKSLHFGNVGAWVTFNRGEEVVKGRILAYNNGLHKASIVCEPNEALIKEGNEWKIVKSNQYPDAPAAEKVQYEKLTLA